MKAFYNKIAYSEWKDNPFAHDVMKMREEKEADYQYFLNKVDAGKCELSLFNALINSITDDPDYIGLVKMNKAEASANGFTGSAVCHMLKKWSEKGILVKNNKHSAMYWVNPNVICTKNLLKMWNSDGGSEVSC